MSTRHWYLGICGAPLCALIGCSGQDSSADDATPPDPMSSAEQRPIEPGESEGEPGPTVTGALEWENLVEGDWTLSPATEDYLCVRKTITRDIYVRAFDGTNPPGTHHTFLSMGPPSGPDGVTQCEATENHEKMVFGSAVGSNAVEYPEGVAVKIEAGSQMLLNLHLFNATTESIAGVSGVEFVEIGASEVEYIGQSLTVGAFDLSLPPMQESSASGSCKVKGDSTVFGVVPHMHQLGSHMKIEVVSSIDGSKVLHDAPYDFDLQLFYPIEPLQVADGDEVRFECTWMNDTDRTVGFGDSTLDEMCFAALYRYPAGDSSFCL